MPRYFVTSSAQFGFSAPVGEQATIVTAHIKVDSVLKAIVGLGSGISEVESPPTTWTYHIVDKELSFPSPPNPGTVSIEWFAQDAGDVNADTYPTFTTPTLDTVADPAALGVSSTTPVADATGVSTRDALLIVFDDNLDVANLDFDLIVLRQVGTTMRIPFSGYVDSADTTRLIIKPRSDLSETTLYELLIADEAAYSSGGDRLGADFTLRFTTGADSFTSISEAAGPGTADRAGPIVVGTSTVITVAPVAILSSSTPSAASSTFCGGQAGDEIIATFSKILDDAVSPTVTLTIESVFGLSEYLYVDNKFWNKTTAPTPPVVLSAVVSVGTGIVTITLDKDLPGNAIVKVTVSGAEVLATGAVVPNISWSFTTCLFPYIVGVAEVRRLVRDYASSDITDEIIAQAIAQAGLDLWFLVDDKAKPQQRCVVKNQVAIELMDDWLAQNGGGLSEGKTLGAFSVHRGLSGGVKPPAYERILKQLDKCWYELSAYFNAPREAVKSRTSALDRPNYRIRTWRESTRDGPPSESENSRQDRIDKLPGGLDAWS